MPPTRPPPPTQPRHGPCRGATSRGHMGRQAGGPGLQDSAGGCTPREASTPCGVRPSAHARCGQSALPRAAARPGPQAPCSGRYLEVSGHRPLTRTPLRQPRRWGRLSEGARAAESPVFKTQKERKRSEGAEGGGGGPCAPGEVQPPSLPPGHTATPSTRVTDQRDPWHPSPGQRVGVRRPAGEPPAAAPGTPPSRRRSTTPGRWSGSRSGCAFVPGRQDPK